MENSPIINTWSEYKAWVGETIKTRKEFFYRGQANSKWKLQTTFHREASSTNITLSEYWDIIIPHAHYYICAWQNQIIDTKNPNEFGAFLALLQHHGFPTPLLDWTLSPYIAAYFAFEEIDDKLPQANYVKIYVFDFQLWQKSFTQLLDIREIKAHVSILFPYAKFNPRIVHQMGSYTLTNQMDVETYLNARSKEINQKFLFSFTFSAQERPAVIRELNLMGINNMTLFPGLDGICRTLKEKFFSKDKISLSQNTFNELLRNAYQQTQNK